MENNDTDKHVLRLLNNRRSLKAFFKKQPLNDVKKISDKVLTVVDELEVEEEKRVMDEKRKTEIINLAISKLSSEGITQSEISMFISKKCDSI